MKNIPPEIIQPILEILSYCATAVLGWFAKWLQGRKASNKMQNQIKSLGNHNMQLINKLKNRIR